MNNDVQKLNLKFKKNIFHKFFDVPLLKIMFYNFIISYIFAIGEAGEGAELFSEGLEPPCSPLAPCLYIM